MDTFTSVVGTWNKSLCPTNNASLGNVTVVGDVCHTYCVVLIAFTVYLAVNECNSICVVCGESCVDSKMVIFGWNARSIHLGPITITIIFIDPKWV